MDDFSLQKVNHQELMELMLHTARTGHSLMVRGGVGVGKTESVGAMAAIEAKRMKRLLLNWVDMPGEERLALANNQAIKRKVRVKKEGSDDEYEMKDKEFFLKDVYLLAVFDTLNKLPEDMGGIPMPVNGFVEWKPAMLFYILCKKGAAGVLFLDEFMQAQQSMQKTCADLFLNKQIADRRLSENVCVLAASNEKHDKCGTIELLEHVKNRMGHYVLNPPSAKQWIAWAKSQDVKNDDGTVKQSRIDARILMFISACPDQLYQPVTNRKEDAFPTPRSWEKVSDLIRTVDHVKQKTFFLRLVAGRVGSGPAAKMKAVLDHDMSQIGPQMVENPDLFREAKWDRKIAFGMWLSGNAKDDDKALREACGFLDRLGTHDMLDTLLYMMKSTVGTPFVKEITRPGFYPDARQALVDMAYQLGGVA